VVARRRRPRRLGLARGRPDAGARHRGHRGRGQAPARDGRAAQPVHQDPGDAEGLPAIEETIAAGIPINVTLIFSLERHREVAEAYIAGLRRLSRAEATRRRSRRSPLLRLARRHRGRQAPRRDRRHDELKGKLAIANAKLAYRTYEEIFSGPTGRSSRAKGATPQRCLWASTSTKNPEYRDVLYVEELIGPHTVNTMPRETSRRSWTTAASRRR
jgi:transaldolase